LELFKEGLQNYFQELDSQKDVPKNEQIGQHFIYMNRENELNNFFGFLVDFIDKFDENDRSGKFYYSIPCIFSGTGMGKTSFFHKGFEKMLQLNKNKFDKKCDYLKEVSFL
jgi:hypothetical protein